MSNKKQFASAYFGLTGLPVMTLAHSMKSALDVLSYDEQIKMVTESKLTLELIDDPTDEMKRIHELKWKL